MTRPRPTRSVPAAILPPFALLLSLGVSGCASSSPDEGEPADGQVTAPDRQALAIEAPRTIRTRDGAYDITWFPTGGMIPVNEPFTVDVDVRKTDEAQTPVTGAEVSMTCFMPDHGHGMLREPRSVEKGDGRYLVEGFLLHMGGYWTVSATVLDQGLAATADDEFTIE